MNRRRPATWLILCAALAAIAAGTIAWRQHRAPVPDAPERSAVLVPVDAHPFDWAPRVAPLAGDGRIGLVDGPAAQARFADPWGLAPGAHGELFITDAGDNDRLRVLQPDGRVTTLAGGAEGFADGVGSAARFDTPSGIAIDGAGNVIVADTGNHAIRKVSPDGVVTTLAGTGRPGWRDGPGAQAQFDGPIGVAVDARGRVLVADTYNDRLRAIAPDGTVSTLAGGAEPGDVDGPGALARFDTPCAVAVDAAGRVWVADTRNDALRLVAPDGSVSTPLRADPAQRRSPLRRPLSLAAARDGALFVGTLYGGLLQVSPAGVVAALVEPGRLVRAAGLAAGPGRRLLVADAAAARLHVLVPRADDAAEPLFDGPAGPAPDRALPATAQRWPLRPQRAWHEIVGTMGEDRGDGQGESRDHFHDGLDVRGDIGQEVVAIADGKVASPLAVGPFGKLNESLGIGELGYVHLRVGRSAHGADIDPARFVVLRDAAGKAQRVRVRRGTRFAAGDVLGTINPMAHVHLWLGVGEYGRNPLQLGFVDYRDHVAPTIVAIELRDGAGVRLAQKQGGRLLLPRGELELVVDAFDQVDDNLPRRRLGLYSLGYRLLHADGTPLAGFEQARTSIEFATLPPDDEIKQTYAADSGITVLGSAETHFRYRVASAARTGPVAAGAWSTAALAPGDYVLRIVAKDWSGNEALRGRDAAIRVQ